LVMSAGSDDVDAAMKCTTGLRSPEVNWPDLCDPSDTAHTGSKVYSPDNTVQLTETSGFCFPHYSKK
jgi:hypothetical protein